MTSIEIRKTSRGSGVELIVDVPAAALPVVGDSARLQQMFVNLLLNAAKYTHEDGKVWFSAREQGNEIVVSVKDTGMGIQPDMLEKVFEMFVQANETLARADGGVGVGLTMVRTIAELHGGTVEARSEGPGKGSEFVVTLPRDYSRAEAVESAASLQPITPQTVLIIEDNADSRRMLQTMLKLDGYEVHTAEDGEKGLHEIFRTKPRFAIVDIGLPGLDGYQVARKVRESLSPDEVFLIALTGYGRPKDRQAVKEAGFDEHLIKPLKPEDLERVLRRSVDGSR